jgi:hypothetical protein
MNKDFNIVGLLWRVAFALALVLVTFNPSGRSYYHWIADGFPSITPAEAIAGIALLGLWLFFVRSTLQALGAFGLALVLAFFASVVWWVVSKGWLDVGNTSAMAWVVLVVVGLALGIGMSWAHIRGEISGQASVNRVDQA